MTLKIRKIRILELWRYSNESLRHYATNRWTEKWRQCTVQKQNIVQCISVNFARLLCRLFSWAWLPEAHSYGKSNARALSGVSKLPFIKKL